MPGLFFCPREHGGPSSPSRQRSRSAPKGGEKNNSPAAQARGNGTTSRPPTSRVSVLTPHTRREPSPPPPYRRSVTHVLRLFCYLCLRVVPCSPHRSSQLSGPFTGLMVRPAVVRLVSETGATPLPLFSPLQRDSREAGCDGLLGGAPDLVFGLTLGTLSPPLRLVWLGPRAWDS